MERAEPAQKRLLVVKLSSLGDLFHALPAVHSLRLGLGARVDWVTQPEYVDLVRCFEGVDRVLSFPRQSLVQDGRAFLQELRRTHYDLIVDLQGLLKSALVARLARGAERIGPSYAREGSRWLYARLAGPLNKNRHAVEEAMDVVHGLGLPDLGRVFPVRFPPRPLETAHPRIALLACSRWPTKNWPPESFAAVAQELITRKHSHIFLLGAPADAPVCASIARNCPSASVTNLCGKTSLVELGSLLQEMDLLVTVDSGPMHMAAALGKPVVAIFGATDPVRTGPFGPQHRVLTTAGLSCRPCRSRQCSRNDLACLHGISPEQVFESAVELLGGA